MSLFPNGTLEYVGGEVPNNIELFLFADVRMIGRTLVMEGELSVAGMSTPHDLRRRALIRCIFWGETTKN
jgi:hypothetical protein